MAKELKIGKIKDLQPGSWIAVKAKVVELWNSDSPSISQIGLLGDETGTVKFIAWEKSDLPKLEDGKAYIIDNAVVDRWKGEPQLKLNKKSQIKSLDDKDLKVKRSDTLEGEILALTPRSGAILKCPTCNRTVKKNICVVHAEIEPVRDIRIGLAVKDGAGVTKVEFSGEEASEVAGLSGDRNKIASPRVEQAHTLDEKELIPKLEDKLVGKVVKLNYSKSNGMLFAKNVELKEDS